MTTNTDQTKQNLLLLLGSKELAIAELNSAILQLRERVEQLTEKVDALSAENSVLRDEAKTED